MAKLILDINSCKKCPYLRGFHMGDVMSGWTCEHPEIKNSQKDRFVAGYIDEYKYSIKIRQSWCPL